MTRRYSIKAYAGPKHPCGTVNRLVLHTWHGTEASRDVEVAAFRTRGERGEISYIEVLDHEAATTDTLYFSERRK